MTDSEQDMEKARQHADCAAMVAGKYPMRACEHLLSAVVAASRAADPGTAFVTLEALPSDLWDRSHPGTTMNTLVRLQGVVADGGHGLEGLEAFAEAASRNAADFLSDVEAHLSRRAAPGFGP